MAPTRRPLRSALLDLWGVAVAVFLCLPAFSHRGLGLSGDLVFSPRQPLTLETVGLGSRAPRAVPLDAVVALVGSLVPGEVLFRVAILAGPVLAGAAAHRLAARSGCGVVPRVLATTLAMWNPYVVERTALGQWALVLAYGVLGWVVLSAAAWRERAQGAPWPVWGWVGLASLTPTGGLLAAVVAVVVGARRGSRTLVLALGCLVLQLPWVLPALLGSSPAKGGTGGAAGAAAFRAGADAPGGTLVSLLGLGGIWDHQSVPSSRDSVLGVLPAVLVVAALAAAWPRMRSTQRRLLGVGLAGLVLALAPRIHGLDAVVRWTVVHVPGGGLLRDSQKWLAPFAVLAVWAAAVAIDRVLRRVGQLDAGLVVVPAVVALALPVLLLPDAPAATWAAVRPVRYPDDFARVRDALEQQQAGPTGPSDGAMVLLPWRSYRRFDWGHRRTASDPAWAWFDVPMVGSSALVVGRRQLPEDDPSEAVLGRASTAPGFARVLVAHGVRWALVYADDPDVGRLDLDGLQRVGPPGALRLYRVPGRVATPAAPAAWRRVVVVGTDVVVLLGWLGASSLALQRLRPANLRRRRAHHSADA